MATDLSSYEILHTLRYHAIEGNEVYLSKWNHPIDLTSWLQAMYPKCDTRGCYLIVSTLRMDLPSVRFIAEVQSAKTKSIDALYDDENFDQAYDFLARRLKGWGYISFEALVEPKMFIPESFYRSPEWQSLRYRALEFYGGKCQACGRTALSGTTIHVDHIKPKFRFPELALKFDNLQVLCADCNLGKRADYITDWRCP